MEVRMGRDDNGVRCVGMRNAGELKLVLEQAQSREGDGMSERRVVLGGKQ